MTTLAAEIQARKDGDAKLQSQIDALTSRVSKLEQAAVPVATPSGATVLFPPSDTPSHFASLVKDRTVSSIVLSDASAGSYKLTTSAAWLVDGDRGGVPLDIGAAPGTQARFTGPGATAEGGLYFGLNAVLKGPVAVHDILFDGVKLPQAGLLEIRRAWGLTIRRVVAKNISVDTAYSTDNPARAVIRAWLAYVSSKGPEGCRDIVLEDLTAVGTARTWSGLQMDSYETPAGAVTVRNFTGSSLAYGLYWAVPGGPYTLDGISLSDTAWNGTSITLRAGTGTYRNLSLVSSGGLSNTSQMVAA